MTRLEKVMKRYEDNSARGSTLSYGLFLAVLGGVMALVSGCSFQVEVGYHGQTGRDDRTQTQLVRDGDDVQARRAGQKY
jgi:hypothetical protein